MKITVNGESVETESENLSQLLVEQGFTGRVATAVNEVFVGSSQRQAHRLRDGDRVEILAPMQGG